MVVHHSRRQPKMAIRDGNIDVARHHVAVIRFDLHRVERFVHGYLGRPRKKIRQNTPALGVQVLYQDESQRDIGRKNT